MLISMRSSLDPCCVAGARLQDTHPSLVLRRRLHLCLISVDFGRSDLRFVRLKANKKDNQEFKVWKGKKEGAWDLRMSCTRAGGGTRKSSKGRPFGFDLQGGRLRHSLATAASRVLYSKIR
jgi:hypothetical protein